MENIRYHEESKVESPSQDKQETYSNIQVPTTATEITIHKDVLPIDAHRDEILHYVSHQSVTVIVGETGCGKSSRLPIILMQHAEARKRRCKIMVSQPRRIAVSSLYKRVKEDVGNKVGMRMGHGVREENIDTQITYVTTGYLVQVLAHFPQMFTNYTHIVIDEVHERSVDGDLVCLFVRRLLKRFPDIKVILMSATIHIDLYAKYFALESEQCGKMLKLQDGNESLKQFLFVGARRFPLEILHLDDLEKAVKLGPKMSLLVNRLMKLCSGKRDKKSGSGVTVRNIPMKSMEFINSQHNLVVELISRVASKGSSVLVFVSGMKDIIELSEKLDKEKLNESRAKYSVFAIHSEIPFEEQEMAFSPATEGEIKVILATNAAESSITLPDVDIVICLGMQKSISYSAERHCAVLCNTWVSKASATQRAGRTGRVRPGRVFRLYSSHIFNDILLEYGEPEILRVPLQETILNLRVMLESSCEFEGVVPLLKDMLQPPDMGNVEQSFEFLYSNSMIDSPSDEGSLTPTGKFVGSLHVGIMCGRLIAYSIMLGVEEEGAMLAAALTLPKSPFRIASPLVHKDPAVYNAIVQKIFLGASAFDQCLYSQPLMLVNLLHVWREMGNNNRKKEKLCFKYGVVYSRIANFDRQSKYLLSQVRKLQGFDTKLANDGEELHADKLDVAMRKLCMKEIVNKLQLILLWAFYDYNLIKMSRSKNSVKVTKRQLILSGSEMLSARQLEALFPPAAVPFKMTMTSEMMHAFDLFPGDFLSRFQCPDLCFSEVIQKMMNISVGNEVIIPFLWMRGPVMVGGNVNDTDVGIDEKREIGLVQDEAVMYKFAIASTIQEEDYADMLTTVEFKLIDCIYFPEISEEFHFKVHEVKVTELLKKSVKRIDKMLKIFFSSFYVCLSSNEKIKVVLKNCQVSLSTLNDIFYEEVPGDVDVIKTQLVAPAQCIDFLPEPISDADDFDMRLKGNSEDDDTDIEGDECTLSSRIEDVALGIRLFKAYKSGTYFGKGYYVLFCFSVSSHKNIHDVIVFRPVLVRQDSEVPNALSPSNVVGSTEWVEIKKANEAAEQSGEVETPESYPSTSIHAPLCPEVKWINIVVALNDERTAILDRHTVPNSMVHLGTDDIYGVAGFALDTGGSIRCENVTVLPPGSCWLWIALMCVAVELDVEFVNKADLEEIKVNDVIPSADEFHRQLDLASNILVYQDDRGVQYNAKLAAAVSCLFSRWTRACKCIEDIAFGIIQYEDVFYYKCPQCHKYFSDLTASRKHAKTSGHGKINEQITSNKLRNQTRASPPENVKSDRFAYCALSNESKVFNTAAGLRQHIATKHAVLIEKDSGTNQVANPSKEKVYTEKAGQHLCKYCPSCKSFSTENGLQQHIATKHNQLSKIASNAKLEKILCKHCALSKGTKVFSTAEGLQQHIATKHSDLPKRTSNTKLGEYLCKHCTLSNKSKVFSTAAGLQQHIATKHAVSVEKKSDTNQGSERCKGEANTKTGQYVCKHCPSCKSFSTAAGLQQHVAMKHNQLSKKADNAKSGKFLCKHCALPNESKVFSTAAGLQQHIATKHAVSVQKKSNTNQVSMPCKEKVKHSDLTKRTSNAKLGEYLCKHCAFSNESKLFSTAALLQQHIATKHAVSIEKKSGTEQVVIISDGKVKTETGQQVCEYCASDNKSKAFLTAHLLQLHVASEHKVVDAEKENSAIRQEERTPEEKVKIESDQYPDKHFAPCGKSSAAEPLQHITAKKNCCEQPAANISEESRKQASCLIQ